MTNPNYIIYDNVMFAGDAEIGDFVIIGYSSSAHVQETSIGINALIRSHSVIYAGNLIGNNFQTGHHVNIRENNKIGDNVSIGTKSVVEHHVIIEDNVRIHTQVFVPEFSILKKNCWLGPNVVLTNAPYPKSTKVKETLAGVTIEENAIVGANATILPGITIGKHAIVGAGSVVTKDVPDYQVVAGNPAKVIKDKRELKLPDGELAYKF